MWRIYAVTFEVSRATDTLSRIKSYRQISKEELEVAVELPTARTLWEKMRRTGAVVDPVLIMMAGPPLSGKSTLAKEIARRAFEPTLLIENDVIREQIVSAPPKFTITEHRRVYNVSWELIRLALANHCNVVFDATNRTDSGRAGAYAAASEHSARVLVIFVTTNPEALFRRYRSVKPERQKAFDKLGGDTYDPKNCSVPHISVESDRPAGLLLKQLSNAVRIPLNLA